MSMCPTNQIPRGGLWVCCQCMKCNHTMVSPQFCAECRHITRGCLYCLYAVPDPSTDYHAHPSQGLYREPTETPRLEMPPTRVEWSSPGIEEVHEHDGAYSPVNIENHVDLSGFSALADEFAESNIHPRPRHRDFEVPKRHKSYPSNRIEIGPEEALHVVKIMRKHDLDRGAELQIRKAEPGRSLQLEQTLYGFRPQDLISFGVLDKADVRPNNLKGDVHPLYAHRNFNISEEFHTFLLPALRLATFFLTEDAVMGFYTTLFFGIREFDPIATLQDKTTLRARIRDFVPPTRNLCQEARDFMIKLGSDNENFEVIFSESTDTIYPDGKPGPCYGLHKAVSRDGYRGILGRSVYSDPQYYKRMTKIKLNSAFWRSGMESMGTQYPDEAQRLRFYLFFACNLAHETAHAISFFFNYTKRAEAFAMAEPYFFDHHIAECGHAWELSVFGGRINPINNDCSCSKGLSVFSWPEVPTTPLGTKRLIHHAISMDYVEVIQQQCTWDKLRRETHLTGDFFHAPTDLDHVAFSLYLNQATTLKQSEIDRVKKDEYYEQYRKNMKELVPPPQFVGGQKPPPVTRESHPYLGPQERFNEQRKLDRQHEAQVQRRFRARDEEQARLERERQELEEFNQDERDNRERLQEEARYETARRAALIHGRGFNFDSALATIQVQQARKKAIEEQALHFPFVVDSEWRWAEAKKGFEANARKDREAREIQEALYMDDIYLIEARHLREKKVRDAIGDFEAIESWRRRKPTRRNSLTDYKSKGDGYGRSRLNRSRSPRKESQTEQIYGIDRDERIERLQKAREDDGEEELSETLRAEWQVLASHTRMMRREPRSWKKEVAEVQLQQKQGNENAAHLGKLSWEQAEQMEKRMEMDVDKQAIETSVDNVIEMTDEGTKPSTDEEPTD